MIEYSLGDRTQGCAAGCPIQITNLQVLVHPFTVPGVDALIFSWPGLQMQTSTLVVQGMMNGLVYDDGHFVIQPGDETLLVHYEGNFSAKFGTALTQNLSGHVEFGSGSITIDEIVQPSDGGAMVIHELSGAAYKTPPTAVIATSSVLECQTPEGVDVTLDSSGTTDVQGQQITARWSVDGTRLPGAATTLSLGNHWLRLTARDVTMGRSFAAKQVAVQDTTPPVWSIPPKADFTGCDAQVDRQVLEPPAVGDTCTGVTDVQLYLVERNGSAVAPPQLLDATAAVLPKGKGAVRWIATDGAGNQASVVQEFEVGVAMFATGHFEVRDRARILQANGAPAALGALGAQASQFGVSSLVGEVQTIGSLFLQNYASIAGLGRAQGAIDKQHGASIGIEQSHTTVNLVGLPWLAEAPTTFAGANFEVQPDQTATLSSAASGVVSVKSRARLIIPFQSTRIRELWIEPDAIVEFASPSASLWIGDRWVHRGALVGSGTLRVGVVGTQVLLERPVRGAYLVAPNARVTITTMATGSKFGLLVGQTVEVQPDVTLWCDRAATL